MKLTQNSGKGFTLIELIVAMFILSIVLAGIISVSVAGFRSYQKSRAIKTVSENIGYAVNLFTKDVRMGKIENTDSRCLSSDINDLKNCLLVTRNSTQEKVCYLVGSDFLAVSNNLASGTLCPNYSPAQYNKIVDLSGTGMTLSAKSGFYAMATDTISPNKIRGWAEINLSINGPTMETDSIQVQTVVSSRDYGYGN